jgi:hypothetical protein
MFLRLLCLVLVCALKDNISFVYTTPKCVLVHSGFHSILSEFGHFYHGEIG